MRILKLRIRNLTTIVDTEIDFANGTLADHPLFLLTGPTGSGKTSILDAMTLALFGEAARLPTQKVHIADPTGELDNATITDSRRLARRGAKECRVMLEFEGNDGQKYTAEWSVGKKRSGAWGDVERCLTLPDGTPITNKKGIDNGIQRVINMDFEQFCQTTMLAQGDFTRFLKSNSNEKSAILEKILKADVYALISKKIFTERGEVQKRKERTESEIAMLKVMTPEEVSEAGRRHAELKAQCEILKTQESDLQAKAQWKDASQKAGIKLQESQKDMQDAEAGSNSPAAAKEKETVELWDKTEKLRQHLRDKDDKQQKRKKEVEKSGTYCAEFTRNISILAARKKTYADGCQKLDELERQIESLKQGQTAALPTNKQEAMEAHKSANERKLQIGKARQSLTTYEFTAKNLSDTQEAQNEMQAKEADLKAKRAEAEAQSKKADEDFIHAKMEHDDFVGRCNIAKELISKLNVGDRCPVCGGTVSEIRHDDEFESLTKPYKDRLAEADKAKQQATDASAKLKSDYEANANHLKINRKTIEDFKVKLITALDYLKKELETCGLEIGDDVDTKKIGDDLDRLEKDAIKDSELTYQLFTLYDKKEVLAKLVTDTGRQIKAANEDEDQARRLLPKWADKQAEDVKDDTRLEVATIWAAFRTNIENWHKAVNEIKEEIAACDTAIVQAEAECGVSADTATSLLKDCTADSINKLRTNIKDREIRLAQARERLKAAEQEAADLKKSAPALAETDTLESLSAARDSVKKLIDDGNREMGSIENSLKTDKENRERRGAKTAELEKTKAELQKWDILNSFLGSSDGKKFRNIALSFILGELLHYANEHLRELTGSRFTLIGDGTLDILIRDAYHGNAPQTPGNLSGGESFMVSLALALGLSSMAKLGDSGADILFIDEGFGTLDNDCLEKVMMMLERLKEKGGKRVGIISHVDILRERIPTQIRVEKENTMQSRVTVVG